MEAAVHIRLLGGLVVETGGTETTVASFERRSGADLVALLALSPRRQLHREQVLDALWPDAERQAAMGRLNKAATFARNALGSPDAVVVANDTLTLFPAHEVAIDCDAIADVDLDDPVAVAAAVEAVGGSLLPDSLYEEWTVEPRSRMHLRQVQVLRAAGRWDRLLELDPTDEGAHVALIEEALDRGDRDGALRRFAALEDVLERELGVVPGPYALELRDRARDPRSQRTDRSSRDAGIAAGVMIDPPRSRTFGRDDEWASLRDDLAQHRLVTVVGPGGSGKTHLARHVGSALAEEFVSGGRLAELGPVDGGEAAAQAILSAVGGLQGAASTPGEAVVALLSGRELLLVVDNCEHVLTEVRSLAEQVLERCVSVSILATSRQPLGIDGEKVHRLDPLDRGAAIELFVAEAKRHGRVIDAADPAVARICTRLDDLPLAVRLAAARARSLDLETLEALLADRLEFLESTDVDGLDHQQTLRETIAWSVNALDRSSRDFLVALSVFADRFGLEDIAAVTESSAVQRIQIIDDLVRRSLLVGPESTDDGPRYRLLESVRLFARASLGDEVRERHLVHLVGEVAAWNRAIGDRDNRGIRRFRAGFDDLRIAFDHALTAGRHTDVLAILVEAGMFAGTTMRFELLDWYRRALDPEPADSIGPDEARAYAGWSVLATFNSDFPLAERLGAFVRDQHPELAEGQWANAWLPWTHGDLDEGRTWLQRILDNPDPASFKWKVAAMHLKSIVDFADGHDVSEAANTLDLISHDLGPPARSLALATRALDALWSDGETAIEAANACITLSDSAGLVNSAMTGRSILTLALTVHSEIREALGAVASTQTYAAERGLWSWVLAGLGTAAAAFERASRPDAAVAVLAAREAAEYRSGLTARLAQLQVDELRRSHPDDFAGWWSAGLLLTPAAAGSFAVRTASELARS